MPFKGYAYGEDIPETPQSDFPISQPTYTLVYDSDGGYQLEESGVDPFYEKIQSYKDSCDLKKQLERFGLPVQGFRGADFTGSPRDILEADALIKRAEGSFNNLAPEVRGKFSDFRDYCQSLADGSFLNRFDKKQDKQEVKKDE